MDLAADFHAYYNKHRVLTEDPALTADGFILSSRYRKSSVTV